MSQDFILSDATESLCTAARDRAQKLEALGRLSGGIAHDFNNLLAVILGNAEILRDAVEDEELKAMAELVMASAEKGADLTRRLLAFGQRQALCPQATDLRETISSLLDRLRQAVGAGIALEFRAETDRPAFVDRDLFESALLNLVLNARDAMPEGGRIGIGTSLFSSKGVRPPDPAPGDYVRVSVTDTGSGMEKAVIERAFDPFFTTREPGKGAGLGLSMVYGFARQSGGDASIESEPGKGSAVHLYLPLAAAAGTAKPVGPAQDSAQPCTGRPGQILVVEDEPHMRRFVSGQLARLGYSVLEAEAGAPALEILRSREKVDLLFTDLVMPGGMSGFDLVEQARALLPDLKVLLTTGYAADADAALLANVRDPVLRKPYKRRQLAEALRDVLEKAA